MLKRIVYLVIILGFSCLHVAQAQEIDLKSLREIPDSNALKIKAPELAVHLMPLSASSVELKVNYWRHWTAFGININQASFSDNWKGGGNSSISIGTLFSQKSDYTKNNITYITDLNFQYGQMRNKGQSSRKNLDRILWDNKLSLKVLKNWSLFTSVTFESQFDAGYRYEKKANGNDSLILVTHFMAPGSFTESFGLEFVKDKTFSLRIGTGTARQTFILDKRLKPTEQTGPRYGVEPGKSFKNDLAFQVTTNLNKNIGKNFNITSRYNLFANYEEISDPEHDLEATLTAKITQLINVTIRGRAIYNSRVDNKVQANQSIALGLTYKLPR